MAASRASALVRQTWAGKWALVTGASAGIGQALAEELAAAGTNLVLTARRQDRLESLSARLRSAHSIEVDVLTADLQQSEAPQQIFDATEGRGRAIDLLVNNAGFGAYGELAKADWAKLEAMIQVNCTAVLHLSRLFLPNMIERRRGWQLIVSSTAAYQPVPYMGVYGATKAFDRMIAEAMAEENKRYGIKVSALCPGPTESEFMDVAGSPSQAKRGYQSAADVARLGLGRPRTGQALGHPLPRRTPAGLCPALRAAPPRHGRRRPDVPPQRPG